MTGLTLDNFTWNDKCLDYEIETRVAVSDRNRYCDLKRQVPRLRDWNKGKAYVEAFLQKDSWNDKYLDYEIETERLQRAV